MADWNLLQELDFFDNRSVCSDGTDIYFAQFGIETEYHVHKYTVATDTITQISNPASWTGTTPKLASNRPGGLIGSSIQFFEGNLYASVFTTDVSNMRVYRYSGAGTAWTNVLSAALIGVHALYCLGPHLIAAPASQIDHLFNHAKYSADGSVWLDASIDTSPADHGAGKQRFSFVSAQEVSPVFVDSSVDNNFSPTTQIIRWFEWDGAGTFNITQSTSWTLAGGWVGDEWIRRSEVYRRPNLHWSLTTLSDIIWKYSETLGDTWLTPTNHNQGSEIFPVPTIGFTAGLQAGDHAGNFGLFEAGVWGTPEVVIGATLGITHAVRMGNSEGFLFAEKFTGGDAIYGRSAPFSAPDVSGSRLWIYRYDGDSWSSRGVITP